MLKPYERVMVTGGLGFIGKHLVEGLLEIGKEVIIADHQAPARGALPCSPRTTFVRMDVRDPHQVRAASQGVDLVFHVAANASVTTSIEAPRFDFETNAVGTFNVMEAAHEAGVKKLVYVSSALVYGMQTALPLREEAAPELLVPYAASKLTGELAARTFFRTCGLKTVIARLFCVYGPRERPERALVEVQRYLRWHLNHLPIQLVGDMDRKTRDFIHIRDVVAGLILLAERGAPGELYNLGSGEEVSMRRLADIISRVTQREARIEPLPHMTEDTYRQVADMSRMAALGFSPRVSLTGGVRELAAELGEYPELPSATVVLKAKRRGVT